MPKGRPVDPVARGDIARLLEGAPRERDHLIEHLHRIQDRFGHLSAAHLNALAEAMKLAQAEVYEVATFYHHFDVVKEGEAAPAKLTVRVCETLSCRMAGAQDLLDRLPALVGRDVRVIAAPCIGRCDQAPAVCVGHNAFGTGAGDDPYGYPMYLQNLEGNKLVEDNVVMNNYSFGLHAYTELQSVVWPG